METRLNIALKDPVWRNHIIGDSYSMARDNHVWQIAYYPIFECGKSGTNYDEPRALVETPMKNGTDFREVPLRYLQKVK